MPRRNVVMVNRLAQRRKDAGISQSKAGRMTGLTIHQISRMENSPEIAISLKTAILFADAYGCNVEDLYEFTIDRSTVESAPSE